MRRLVPAVAAVLMLILAPAAQAGAGNPCLGAKAKRLLCPDLVMRKPFGLFLAGTRLHAGNAIVNVGRGPAELAGRRVGPRFMRARQHLYKRGGGKTFRRTGARLVYKLAHAGLHWWKWLNAARFELWRLDAQGHRVDRVRVGPKVAYCLRDLAHYEPRRRGSPAGPVYPACSTSPFITRARLGTSVGWADVYPPAYPEQWIETRGLRGCFVYRHIADPNDRIYESDESNNVADVVIRLPYRAFNPRGGCRGRGNAAPRPRDPAPSPYAY